MRDDDLDPSGVGRHERLYLALQFDYLGRFLFHRCRSCLRLQSVLAHFDIPSIRLASLGGRDKAHPHSISGERRLEMVMSSRSKRSTMAVSSPLSELKRRRATVFGLNELEGLANMAAGCDATDNHVGDEVLGGARRNAAPRGLGQWIELQSLCQGAMVVLVALSHTLATERMGNDRVRHIETEHLRREELFAGNALLKPNLSCQEALES
jgi:hypothetical protein